MSYQGVDFNYGSEFGDQEHTMTALGAANPKSRNLFIVCQREEFLLV